MVTLRTPPQRVNASPGPAAPGIEDVGSESEVFKPRKPVLRTPPGGFTAAPVEDAREEEEDVEMEVDPSEDASRGASSNMGLAAASTTPARAAVAPPNATTTPSVPPIPASKTPPPQIYTQNPNVTTSTIPSQPPTQLTTPPAEPSTSHSTTPPIPTGDMVPEILAQTYGTRYKNLTQALESALKASTSKWTTQEFKNSLPTLAKSNLGEMERQRNESAKKMTEEIRRSALEYFEHYKVGPNMKLLDEVVEEAKEWRRANPGVKSRPNAWRPDITPAGLVAATNLPTYDAAYQRLRVEYIELHKDCQSRYSSIMAKQAALAELEGSVSEGVIELEKTIKALEGFPNPEMLAWTEDAAARLPGTRDQ